MRVSERENLFSDVLTIIDTGENVIAMGDYNVVSSTTDRTRTEIYTYGSACRLQGAIHDYDLIDAEI